MILPGLMHQPCNSTTRPSFDNKTNHNVVKYESSFSGNATFNIYTFFAGSISQIADPCVERTIIEDKYQRSTNYTVQPGEEHLCDHYSIEGW